MLPQAPLYQVFDFKAKAGNEVFSGAGDLDMDGLTNLEEYNLVKASVPAAEVKATFVAAAMDPYNFWQGNPGMPAATLAGLGALAGAVILAARRMLQR